MKKIPSSHKPTPAFIDFNWHGVLHGLKLVGISALLLIGTLVVLFTCMAGSILARESLHGTSGPLSELFSILGLWTIVGVGLGSVGIWFAGMINLCRADHPDVRRNARAVLISLIVFLGLLVSGTVLLISLVDGGGLDPQGSTGVVFFFRLLGWITTLVMALCWTRMITAIAEHFGNPILRTLAWGMFGLTAVYLLVDGLLLFGDSSTGFEERSPAREMNIRMVVEAVLGLLLFLMFLAQVALARRTILQRISGEREAFSP